LILQAGSSQTNWQKKYCKYMLKVKFVYGST
jgi:hypothetical protein